jgi:hypothetical protein
MSKVLFVSLVSACCGLACGGRTVQDGTQERFDVPTPARAPSPGASTLGGFVTVGAKGFLVSGDGATWEARGYGVPFEGVSVASLRGRVVAVGKRDSKFKSVVAVTRDLRTWHTIDLGPADCALADVAVIKDAFVAVGGSWDTGACAFTSPDGETWSALAGLPQYSLFSGLVHGGDAIVAMAHDSSDRMIPALLTYHGDSFESVFQTLPDYKVGYFNDGVNLGDRIVMVDGNALVAWNLGAPFAPVLDGEKGVGSWDRVLALRSHLVLFGSGKNDERNIVGVRARTPNAALTIVLDVPRSKSTFSGFTGASYDGSNVVGMTSNGAIWHSSDEAASFTNVRAAVDDGASRSVAALSR